MIIPFLLLFNIKEDTIKNIEIKDIINEIKNNNCIKIILILSQKSEEFNFLISTTS